MTGALPLSEQNIQQKLQHTVGFAQRQRLLKQLYKLRQSPAEARSGKSSATGTGSPAQAIPVLQKANV